METKDFVLGYGAGKNSAVSEKIVEEVDAWLDEHITNPDSPPLDRSLTSSSAAAPADMVGDINDDVGDLRNTLNTKADIIYDIASGDIASFPDGADGLPVKDLTVGIEPVQDTSGGDPSPTHICPISGWTGCNISHSGADTSDPTVIPISWQSEAGTVYGGTLDVTTGVLTVDRAIVDLGTLTWIVSEPGSGRYYAEVNGIKLSDVRTLEIICSCFKTNVAGGAFENCSIYNSNFSLYAVNNNFIDDVSGFAESVTDQAAVYPLAQSQTYQLTPQEVTTLLGQNNIWTDCGPSTVEYPCDTKLYIQKINTPTDDDMIADANIASGQYFIVNNNLYLSTAAILAGDPIKLGTNCTLTNLAAALNAINS